MTKEENQKATYPGIVIRFDGESKVGKTHAVMSACEFKGYKGEIYDLPAGTPMYFIDTERNARGEYKRNFKGKKIFIKEVYIEDGLTLEVDTGLSFETVKEMCYNLTKKRGVVVIDSLTDFCEWLDDDMVLRKKKEGNFNPFDYGKRNLEIKNFLRKMKNMGMIVLYTAGIKPKYDKTGGGVWDFSSTGEFTAVVTRGTDYWCDLIIRVEKQLVEGKIVRKSIITGSRFEDKTVNIKEVVSSNEFIDIIEKIKKYL